MRRLVRLALEYPYFTILFAAFLIVAGFFAFNRLDIEAYPDPVPPLVEVIAQPAGWSAEEVERAVTMPLEKGLAGIPGIEHIRSQSIFGLSSVKCYFRWGTDYEVARQEVINRLQFISLPNGLMAEISPWNAIGEIYRYFLKGEGYSLQQLKATQDWTLEHQFRQVQGVIDVCGFGGEIRQYQVNIDPVKLHGRGIAINQITEASEKANENTGGQRIEIGEQSFTVRGVGLIKNITDIENIIITKKNNVPIFVNDVASVKIGAAPRLGQVGIDENDDVVQGIILMRNGGSTLKTLKGIKERIDYIRNNRILPPGIEIVPYYDRSELVSLTTHTVLENFFVGMSLVIIILFVFLGNVRASAIAAVNIPFALLISFCGLVITGTPANLLSLGAVDFGIVVESTIIIVENKILHIHNNIGLKIKAQIQSAIHDVGRPMVFSTLILAVAFIPLFTMQGTEGAIFSPMAYTYAFAIGGALILSLTLTPVLGYFFMRKTALKAKKQRSNNGPVFEENTWVMKQIHRAYRPLLDMTLKHPKVTVAIWAIFVAGGLCCYSALGGEFMPKLEEGNLWIRGTMPISASLEQSVSVANRMRTILKQHPEIASVSSQVGRPDDGTDVAGFCNIELFAPLKPQKEWKRGVTKESLTNVLSKDLSEKFPNITLSFSQMISDNVEEALSGVKGENSIKIFGSDLYKNENIANEIISVLKTVRGITDLGVFGSLGQPSVRIEPDRIACAQYNLNPGDVVALVQTAIGGETVSEVFEGDQRFDLVVRWNKDYRSDIASITRLEVPTHNDGYVPIGQVAQIIQEDSPAVIFRENGHRYSPIKFSVRGRDLQSTVLEAQKIVSKEVRLPWDVHLSWSGEIDSLKNAISRLAIIVPITLLLIAFLAHAAVKDWLLGVVVFAGIPVACTGGLFALWIAGLNFSISAAMGFISIFGITVQYALIVVSYFQHQINSGHTLEQSVRAAGIARLRMALMTTLVATLGLLPAAVSTKIGVQTQKPLAAVIIGGTLAIAVVLTALLPAMILQAHKWARHERD